MDGRVRTQIRHQIDALATDFDADFSRLRAAWEATKRWNQGGALPSAREGLLVPYIGSGLNNLASGGLGSWDELTRLVALASGSGWSAFEVRRSRLSSPQLLELYLRKAIKRDTGLVANAFRKTLRANQAPSRIHARLMRMFPVVATSNYNRLLAMADTTAPPRPEYDFTDPDTRFNIWPPTRSLLYVHGKWEDEVGLEEQQRRIFAGVGLGEADRPKCIVLSEHQYFRLYNQQEFFRDRVRGLFGEQIFPLFLGASLSGDETGIHSILTERKLKGGGLAGLYVGLEIDPIRRDLLDMRGIRTLSIDRSVGFSREAVTFLFDVLLDVLEERLSPSTARLAAPKPTLPPPDIVCVGLSSWSRVLSLGATPALGTETSYNVEASRYIEEPGGQHLYPALHLALRGHRVAIATAIGDDEAGDRLIAGVRSWIERSQDRPGWKGGDLLLYYVTREHPTRVCTTITYGGTRVIFDYKGRSGAVEDLGHPVDALAAPQALYLGGYFPGTQEAVLNTFENTVPLRFFESGTRGPDKRPLWKRSVGLAKRCTHVLASSEFTLRVVGEAKLTDTQHTAQCQQRVADDSRGSGSIVTECYRRLWPAESDRVLVVLMGSNGAVIARRVKGRLEVTVRPAIGVARSKGINWLGCGDLFRAEFISQLLGDPKRDPVAAVDLASGVVAKRIRRMPFLEAV